MKKFPSLHIVLAAAAVAAAAVLASWYFFIRDPYANLQTLSVHRADFVQEVNISGAIKASQDVSLGFTQSGKLSAIYAKVGDSVKKGDTIAEISNADLKAAVSQAQAALSTQKAGLSSLEAGTRPEQLAVTRAQVESDQAALAQANQALADAIESGYTAADDTVHNKADSLFDNPLTQNPTLRFSTSNTQLETTLVSERVSIEVTLTSLHNAIASLSAQSDLATPTSQVRATLSAVSAFLSDANETLNAAIPTTAAPQSALDTYTVGIATARASVNEAVSALTAAKTAQDAAQTRLTKDQKTLDLELAGSTAQDIDAQQSQVAAAQAAVANAQAQLAKTLVVAPFDGTITRMDAKVGEIISPSASEMAMISHGTFQIEAYIPEIYIASVAPGQSATTTLDAYGPNVSFAAQVVSVDPSATLVGGVPTYKTTLQLLANDARIRSGMTANVTIDTGTIPDAIAVPQGAVFQRGAQAYVQVLRGRSLEDVPVVLGTRTTLGNAVVTSGLSEGDTVVLNPSY